MSCRGTSPPPNPPDRLRQNTPCRRRHLRGVLRRRFRIAQVAEAFGCAPRTVRSWIEKGLLERENIGNAVFIREDQIEAMLLASTRREKASNLKHKYRISKNTTK
jgi:uncharacterized protein YjcR